jgi:hypothetical protein
MLDVALLCSMLKVGYHAQPDIVHHGYQSECPLMAVWMDET